MTEYEEDKLQEIMDEHEHRESRSDILNVPTDRRVLQCHECQEPIAENRNDGYGWRWL